MEQETIHKCPCCGKEHAMKLPKTRNQPCFKCKKEFCPVQAYDLKQIHEVNKILINNFINRHGKLAYEMWQGYYEINDI